MQPLEQPFVEPLHPAGPLRDVPAPGETLLGADQQDHGVDLLGLGRGDAAGVEVACGAVGQRVGGAGGVAVGQGAEVVAVGNEQPGGRVGRESGHDAGLVQLVAQEPQAVPGG